MSRYSLGIVVGCAVYVIILLLARAAFGISPDFAETIVFAIAFVCAGAAAALEVTR